jgi:hypothetical protein
MQRKLIIIMCGIFIILPASCSLEGQSPTDPPDTTAPENCTNFKVASGKSDLLGFSHLCLSWKDPDDADLAKVIINIETDGLILDIPKGQENHTIQDAHQGKYFRFRYCTEDKSGNRSTESTYSMTTTDNGRYVSGFKAHAGDGEITLSWTNPDYQGFDHLYFRYHKEGRDPINYQPLSDEVVERYLTKDTTSLHIDNLINGRSYMFYLQTIDREGNLSTQCAAGGIPVAAPAQLQSGVTYTTADGLLYNQINDVHVTQSGMVAVSSPRGVSVWDGTAWTNYDQDDVPISPSIWIVRDVYMAENGNIYAGNNDGIFVFDGTEWKNYSTEAGLTNDEVWGLIGDSDGNIYCGTQIGGTYLFDGDQFIRISNYSDPNAYDIDVDSQGNLYVAHFHLYIYDGENWTAHYSHQNGIVQGAIHDVFALAPDKIIVGSYEGLSVYNGITWTTWTTEDGLVSNGVTCVFMTDDGRLYAGTGSGLAYYNGSSWQNFVSPDWNGKNEINSIFVDSNGKVYMATDAGLTVAELP